MNSQDYFCREAQERAKVPEESEETRVFIPAEHPQDE